METEKTIEERLNLTSQMKGGASWFYWIAGLSLINSIVIVAGQDLNFVVGLIITQVFDLLAKQGTISMAVAIIIDIVLTGVIAMFGVYANRGKAWAFIAGMIVYALDGMLIFISIDFFSLAFHALALFFIFRGYQAYRKLAAAGAVS